MKKFAFAVLVSVITAAALAKKFRSTTDTYSGPSA